MSFDPCTQWDGTSIKLDKTRTYHQTTPLSPEQQRAFIAKAKGQDKRVWVALRALTTATPRQIHAHIKEAFGLNEVRRSLNTLTNAGLLRKGECVTNQLGRPEHQWIA